MSLSTIKAFCWYNLFFVQSLTIPKLCTKTTPNYLRRRLKPSPTLFMTNGKIELTIPLPCNPLPSLSTWTIPTPTHPSTTSSHKITFHSLPTIFNSKPLFSLAVKPMEPSRKLSKKSSTLRNETWWKLKRSLKRKKDKLYCLTMLMKKLAKMKIK